MARIEDPTLFSQYFGIDPAVLEEAGLVDPFIDVDTELFIDPVLLEKSVHAPIREGALATFRGHFTNFVRLLAISEREGDAAWRAAQNLLDLHEPPQNGLGYGGSGRSGSSRPDDVRDAIMRTSKKIIQLGARDPEMVSLMGFFEENVGPDTISDFTTRAIISHLAEITEEFCKANGIPVRDTNIVENRQLPYVMDKKGRETPMVLVPRDIVRDLPVANDWSDVEAAAFQNAEIRRRVNALVAGIAQPTIADRKAALRAYALESEEDFNAFLATVKDNVAYYDPNEDALGYYRFKQIIAAGYGDLRAKTEYQIAKGPDELYRVVRDAVMVFKHHVENGNLWCPSSG